MSKKIHLIRLLLVVALAGAVAGCDQGSKRLAQDIHQESGDAQLLGGLVEFRYALNSGGFLGFGSDMSPTVRWWVFTLGSGIFLALTTGLLLTSELTRLQALGLALLLGGGLSNLLDRVLLAGVVRDFAVVRVGPLSTGIFNLADVAILLGVALLLLPIRGPDKADRAEDEPTTA